MRFGDQSLKFKVLVVSFVGLAVVILVLLFFARRAERTILENRWKTDMTRVSLEIRMHWEAISGQQRDVTNAVESALSGYFKQKVTILETIEKVILGEPEEAVSEMKKERMHFSILSNFGKLENESKVHLEDKGVKLLMLVDRNGVVTHCWPHRNMRGTSI